MAEPDRDDATENHAPPTAEPLRDSVGEAPTTEPAGPGPASEVGPGSLLFGRRLIRKLGEGGMGDVWLVLREDLGSERALKRIVAGIAADPRARSRFRAEARTLAAISHPNVVVLHDASLGEDGRDAYIEMEYVRGEPLDRRLTTGSAMPLDWIARVVRQLCDALGAVHERGIVHRDLKPSNLMLVDGRPTGREWLKVLDFGVAKALLASPEDGTLTGGFIGTYPYAAPEQICGAAGVSSDLYSVGVLLHQMATGHRPFAGPMARVLHDHLHTPPPPISSVRPDLAFPPAFETLVLRCLAKDPADRPGSAAELAEALEAAARDDRAAKSVEIPPTVDHGETPARRRSRRWSRAALLAMAGVSVALAIGDPRSRRRPPAPAADRPPEASRAPTTPAPRVPDSPAPPPAEPPTVAAIEPAPAASVPAPVPPVDLHVEPASVPPDPAPTPVPALPAVALARAEPVAPTMTPRPSPKPPPEPRAQIRNGVGMTLARVPEPAPASGYFYLGVHEVTQGVYEKVMGVNPSFLADSDAHPVTNVSWLDALEFCNALSLKDGREPFYQLSEEGVGRLGGAGYRLPTEAEWEFACSQGAPTLFSFGNDLGALGQHAWFAGNSRPLGEGPADIANRPVPHAVGLKPPNRLGLRDLHGNVAEWCWDASGPDRRRRAIKGGSFGDKPQVLRAGRHDGEPWNTRDLRIGFRVARDASAGDRAPGGRAVAVERFREP